MALTRTLSELRDTARALADEVESDFITDAQLDFWINQAIAALWDLVTQADPDRYYKVGTIPTTEGTKNYALPPDFYKLRALDLISGNEGSNSITILYNKEENPFRSRKDIRVGVRPVGLAPGDFDWSYCRHTARSSIGGWRRTCSFRPSSKIDRCGSARGTWCMCDSTSEPIV